ncbi:type 4b pilus protein PilO2 [Marinobacter gelidimuriae]|jgi:hypothetical protein|uniref:type 4b pilus protein PilO2 n=1 Tax=Marinobacter gelidimuriae TaxID=2739064 RepID=UPI00037D10A2|nr:type 4b pilus protein PilO2 [Marinobacter gelidimuriae]
MPAIHIEGLSVNPVIVGFDWETINQKELVSRAKTANLEKKATFSRKIKISGEKKVSFGTIPESHLRGIKGGVSLAAWLNASVDRNTVFAVERISPDNSDNDSKDLYWLCVVNSGEIISGTDVVLDWPSVNTMVSDLLDVFDRENTLFVGNGVASLDVLVGSNQGNEPIAGVLNKSRQKNAVLKSAINSKNMLLSSSIGAALLAVTLGGYLYYTDLQEKEADQERTRQLQTQRLDSAQRSWAETLEDSQRRAKGEHTLDALVGQRLASMRPTIAGWELRNIECLSGNCTAGYENTDLSQPEFLKRALADICDSVELDRPGLVATCSFSYPDRQETIDVGDRSWLLKEGQWDAVRSDIMSLTRLRSAIAYSFGEVEQVSFPGKGLLKNVDLFQIGSYALNTPLSHYPAVLSLFEKYPGISVIKLEFNASQQILTISGLIYVEDSL